MLILALVASVCAPAVAQPSPDRSVAAPTDDDLSAAAEGVYWDEEPSAVELEVAEAAPDVAVAPPEPVSLPTGEAKSAVTPQALSLPSGEGSIEGMGESFAPILSSGTGTYRVPLVVPPGRAGVQPGLALNYSTGGGNGPLGFGWSLQVPFIARQTDRGLPRYVDEPAWHPREDRFLFNGGQELVPVDGAEAAALDGGVVPAELAGWQQYRARIEGGFNRFFRSPDGLRWVVQDKSGTRYDFGALPLGDGPDEMVAASVHALQSEHPHGSGRIFAWLLTRTSDSHGSVVYYRYVEDEGQRYLSEIFYASPATCGTAATPAARRSCGAALSQYGRRVAFVYELRPDDYSSYVSTWRVVTAWRLRRVEMTAAEGAPGARSLVRRYHLRYEPEALSFHSLLSEVQLEGRPAAYDATVGVLLGDRHYSEAFLSDAAVGELLPPLRFRYSQPMATTGSVGGFPGIDGTVLRSGSSPSHSVDEARTDLFDVNSDGLPDVIVTDPATYRTPEGGPATAVFFNGYDGPGGSAGQAGSFSPAVPMAVPSDVSFHLSLGNGNVRPLDIDGDGRSDLLHMPRTASYGYFAVTRNAAEQALRPAGQGWAWVHVPVALPDGVTDPRIDFGADGARIELVDVNNDHLVDVVRTTGTGMQTFLNLGWLPGGDGRFGSAELVGGAWQLSTAPIESCVLHAGVPVDFGDPGVRLADLNGDGLQDIAHVSRGRIVYWPGRGPGLWGDGPPTCAEGSTAGDRHIEVGDAPRELNPELRGVHFADLDGDGAADVIQVAFDTIDVWFNQAGHRFTGRVTARMTPRAPDFLPRVRVQDIDGSGTTDILFGNAGRYEWVDPMGGVRPRMLVEVDNGLGALSTFEYESSADDYLRDLSELEACGGACEGFTWSHVRGDCDARLLERAGVCAYRSGGSPVISTVVRAITTTDRFDMLGREANVTRTEYRYHDAYYEGIEQENRGFGAADAIQVGDANHPTATTRTHFHQGRRPNEIASDRLAHNPDEALKAMQYLSERRAEDGTYADTTHSTVTVRELLVGLDGTPITYAYVSRSDTIRYDTAPFTALAGTTLDLDGIVREQAGGANATVVSTHSIAVRGDRYARMATTSEVVDDLGHVLRSTQWGRIRGEFDETLPDERIVSRQELTRLNDESGFLFVSRRTWTEGADGIPLGRTTDFHDPLTGDVVRAEQEASLATAMAFDFAGDGEAEGFTQTDQLVVQSARFDPWGKPTATCAGGDLVVDESECLRYGELDYDDDYAQFVVAERVAVSRNGGSFQTLETTATWDRGLGELVQAADPNGLVTDVGHDGLGRLVFVRTPPVSGCPGSTVPSMRVEYEITTAPDVEPVSRIRTITDLSCTAVGTEVLETIAYVDGAGRTRAVLATGDETHAWVRSGIARYDARGAVETEWQTEFFDVVAPTHSEAVAIPATPASATRYDAFDRVGRMVAPDGAVSRNYYHALSADACDPNDLDPAGAHYGTCTTVRHDGHGRAIDQVLRNRQPGVADVEHYRLWTDYRADGVSVRLARAQTTDDSPRPAAETMLVDARYVERRISHDTIGRRLAATDPDTDSRDPGAAAANRTWRYLMNRVGDLVAVRDPRGCGQNFYYDHAGRLVGEAYVTCDEAQPSGEVPDESVPAGSIALDPIAAPATVHARNYYDAYPSWAGDVAAAPPSPLLGRPTASSDRGQRSIAAYDDRGNVVWEARQVALIAEHAPVPASLADAVAPDVADGVAAEAIRSFDESHTYERAVTFDHAGRPMVMGYPVDPDWTALGAAGAAPVITGRLSYGRRGLVVASSVGIDATEQPVIASVEYLRDGLVGAVQYGDDAGGTRSPTITTSQYDVRRRPTLVQTLREAALPSPSRRLAEVSVLMHQRLHWDPSDNLVHIEDLRTGDEWPDGQRPQSVRIGHDSLYRVTSADYYYAGDGGVELALDAAADWRVGRQATNTDGLSHRTADPMRSRPAPMLSELPVDRVANLTYAYDWLGNMTEWTDDAQSFYERSLGAITNGADVDGDRPSTIRLGTNLPSGPHAPDPGIDRGGWVETDYGEGGNLVAMTVHAQCRDLDDATSCNDDTSLDLEARRAQLRSQCRCIAEQHYRYYWDEVNRLAEARRYDRTAGTGDWNLVVRQRYRYDGANQRTVKQTLSSDSSDTEPPERTALYVYPGDYERRGVVVDHLDGAYEPDAALGTESQYGVAGARLVWKGSAGALGTLDRDHRLTVALTDVIGSTSAVLDVRTGALLETTTFYPSGARESWFGQDEVSVAPEPAGFTGKEADEDVGLVYFGERYLVPHLARWASPDPLQTHAAGGGEALNSYHYVAGNLLQSRDPIGLAPAGESGGIGPGLIPDRRHGRVENGRFVFDGRTELSAKLANQFPDGIPVQTVTFVEDGVEKTRLMVDFRGLTDAHGNLVVRGTHPIEGGFKPGRRGQEIAEATRKFVREHGADAMSGLTWHHAPDNKTLQLVSTELHQALGHYGGSKMSSFGKLTTAFDALGRRQTSNRPTGRTRITTGPATRATSTIEAGSVATRGFAGVGLQATKVLLVGVGILSVADDAATVGELTTLVLQRLQTLERSWQDWKRHYQTDQRTVCPLGGCR